jgi:hypothetical protein
MGVATWTRLNGNTEWDSEYTVRLVPDAEMEFPELLGDGGNDLGRHAVPGVR